MDSGASSHLSSSSGNLSSISSSLHLNSNIIVGNGTRLPITCSGHTLLPNSHRPLHPSNVLVLPQLIANLISVCKFTTDNSCSVEFDPFGLSVKDLQTKTVLHRCDSSRDLYLLLPTSASQRRVLLAALETIWHQRLGHPGVQVLSRLRSNNKSSPACAQITLFLLFPVNMTPLCSMLVSWVVTNICLFLIPCQGLLNPLN
jgi:hypothetical protein